jgi:ABC-type sugar transport system substrate-binding protein
VRALGKKVYNIAKPKEGGIIVTGMNGTQEALEAVEAGVLTATYSGNSELVGAAEIELLYKVASGQMAKKDMPAVIVCPYKRYDGSNLKEAVYPLNRKIEKGIVDKFINYSTDPATIDDFLEFVKTL